LETMRRHRRWIQPAAAVLLAAAAWLVFTYRVARGMPDFEVYRNAGSRAAAAEPLYREADGDYQFKYFPAFAIVAIPLAAVPLPAAKAIWFGAGVASLVVLLRIGPRVLPEMRRSTRWLGLVALVALGKYYARDLLLGQVNVIFTLVATGAIAPNAPAQGFFQPPVLLADVPPDHPLAQEEIFGPILVAMPFDTEAEAVTLANGTAYGLVAGVWTRDGGRQMRLARALKAGQVFVNDYGAGGGVELPFGGVKKSGHGREKGWAGLLSFTTLKTVAIKH